MDRKTRINADFLNVLGQLPTACLRRNDPCHCGSEKKYKNCCLNKDSAPSKLRLESFQITWDPLTPEESQNDYPPISEEDEELMATLHRMAHKNPEAIDSENCNYFRQLNALQIKYPDYPVIDNYIANGYQLLGWDDKVNETVEKTYEKFPNYLFAQTARASLYLNEGSPEKALEVLKGAYTLKQLYPHRDVFHVTEVRAFETLMVKYFCALKDLEQAEKHLQILEGLFEKDGDDLLLDLQKMVRKLRGVHNLNSGFSRLQTFIRKTKQSKSYSN